MKRAFIWVAIAGLTAAGCGKKGKDSHAQWFETPDRVIQGIMKAYESRDDSLYAAFLAEGFAYTFEPQGADSGDVLTWGKSEEVLSASSLFSTPDVESVRLSLNAGSARPSPGPPGRERMTVPVEGGQLVISVKDKEPTVVKLNRQELILEKMGEGKGRWVVVEWHDYPAAPAGDEAGGTSESLVSTSSGGTPTTQGSAPKDSAKTGKDPHNH